MGKPDSSLKCESAGVTQRRRAGGQGPSETQRSGTTKSFASRSYIFKRCWRLTLQRVPQRGSVVAPILPREATSPRQPEGLHGLQAALTQVRHRRPPLLPTWRWTLLFT